MVHFDTPLTAANSSARIAAQNCQRTKKYQPDKNFLTCPRQGPQMRCAFSPPCHCHHHQ